MSGPDVVSFPVSEQLTAALGELVRFTAGAGEDTLRCLAACRLCRNSLLYVLDTEAGNTDFIAVRLRAVPLSHQGHGRPGHPDGNPPRIRDLRQFIPVSDLDRP